MVKITFYIGTIDGNEKFSEKRERLGRSFPLCECRRYIGAISAY